MKDLSDFKIAVVALGLMGASMAGKLRGQCRKVTGIARRRETIVAALERGLVDEATDDLAKGVQDADIVVLATPVRALLGQIDALGPLLPEGCLLSDMGSTKREIMARMANLPSHVQPLGGHPMCGREVSGIEGALLDLYQDATYVLVPLERTSQDALEMGLALVEAVGAKPLILDAERHDQAVAFISHLPYLLSSALVGAGMQQAETDDLVWQVATSGFRDTSRVAASDVTMWLDILLTNQDAVDFALARFGEQLGSFRSMLQRGDEDGLRAALESIKECRSDLNL